jgi:predicted phosphatase
MWYFINNFKLKALKALKALQALKALETLNRDPSTCRDKFDLAITLRRARVKAVSLT